MATDQERIQMLEQQVASLKAQIAALLGDQGATAQAAFSAPTTSSEGAAAASLDQVTASLQRVLQDAQDRPGRASNRVAATMRSMDVELRAFVSMPASTATGTVTDSAQATSSDATDAPSGGTGEIFVSTPAMGQAVDAQALSVFRFSFATVPTPPGATGGKVS